MYIYIDFYFRKKFQVMKTNYNFYIARFKRFPNLFFNCNSEKIIFASRHFFKVTPQSPSYLYLSLSRGREISLCAPNAPITEQGSV